MTELLERPYTVYLPYRWRAGLYLGRFFQELKDRGRIWANICPRCGAGHLPPRIFCGRCLTEMGEWVEVGPRGTVLDFIVVMQPFSDVSTGKPRKVPYTSAVIALDGAPVSFTHFLDETDPSKLKRGLRVEAVFKPPEQRQGRMTDILYFRVLHEEEGR